MGITRRQILAATAAAAGTGMLGVGALGYSWWDRPAGQGLKVLSAEEHRFAQMLAEAWMPPGGTPALSGADARLGDWLDELLAAQPETPRTQLKLLMHGLDHLTIPTRLMVFQGLSLEDRTAELHSWIHSDRYLLRSAGQAVLVLLSLGWTMHPDVKPHVAPWFLCGVGR